MVAFRTRYSLPADFSGIRESARLDCLYKLGILEAGADPSIDNLVACTANFFRVPMALATLITRDKQVYKSRHGIVGEGTDRSASICQYTIRQRGVFCVSDTWRHPVLKNYAAVRDYPHIRFYAGSPIMIHGEHAIGSLCIMDREAHAVAPGQLDWLKHFASILSHIIEINYIGEDEQLVRTLLPAPNRAALT